MALVPYTIDYANISGYMESCKIYRIIHTASGDLPTDFLLCISMP